jgi:hypothetical protein
VRLKKAHTFKKQCLRIRGTGYRSTNPQPSRNSLPMSRPKGRRERDGPWEKVRKRSLRVAPLQVLATYLCISERLFSRSLSHEPLSEYPRQARSIWLMATTLRPEQPKPAQTVPIMVFRNLRCFREIDRHGCPQVGVRKKYFVCSTAYTVPTQRGVGRDGVCKWLIFGGPCRGRTYGPLIKSAITGGCLIRC